MILRLFRLDNRWLVKSTRSHPTRGSVVYKPTRKQVAVTLNGDECHLRIGQLSGSTVYTLFRADCMLHGTLRTPLPATIHWKSNGKHMFTVKAMSNEARLVLQGGKRNLARMRWLPRGPRIAIEASDREIGELGLPVILGLFTPLLITHPVDSSVTEYQPDYIF